MGLMQCVVKTAAGEGFIELTKKQIPEPGPRDILVRVLATAVCGTDVTIQHWQPWAEKRITPPLIIGHEFVGEVVEVGSAVSMIKKGDLVSAETHVVCNHCELCRNGYEHVCYNTQVLGVHIDGSFAEYISFPAENAFVCDPSISVEILSLMEPLGAAVHAAMEFPLGGKIVAVAGCGPIGLMGLLVAKKMGARSVIAVEPNKSRSALALELGADALVDPSAEDPVTAVKNLSDGRGVDVVLEFSGSLPGIKAALQYVKPEGKIAAVGLPARQIDFDFAEFVYRGLTLRGIAGRRMYGTWEQMSGLLKSGLDLSRIVTHVLPLSEYEEGLRLMHAGECCKVILKP